MGVGSPMPGAGGAVPLPAGLCAAEGHCGATERCGAEGTAASRPRSLHLADSAGTAFSRVPELRLPHEPATAFPLPLTARLYDLEYPRSLGVYNTYQEVQSVVD